MAASLIVGFFWVLASQAQYSSSGTVESPDAIGVRIVPNPNHYSITRWYESQGFQGSPQALLVDGYEAIRDGRTVYVNAANIDQSGKNIYTNIYLISYNQDSAPKTVDILGQIISHWKFNSNLVESGTPVCAISALSCASDSDCGQDQACATSASGTASSSCLLKTAKNCLTDSDCPANFFCNSLKAKITRDIKRIGRLEELKEALFNYKKANGRYPTLSAGTYLPGQSVSLWPSWSQNLLTDLAVAQSFLDPVNRLGACPGYDVKTCWDKDRQKFAYDPSGNSLTLPAGSQALVYSVDSQGSDYNLCATMESRETALNYHFSPNDPSSSACVLATGIISNGQATNTAPQLLEQSLIGEANQEFNGFIKVTDKEANPLSWSLQVYPSSGWAGWSGAPILKDTSNPNQKKVYAARAGNAGTYNMTLKVNDGQGGLLSVATPIKILSSMISIEADDEEYVLDPSDPLTYEFFFTSNNLNTPGSSYQVTKVSGPFDLLTSLNAKSFSQVASNKYKVSYKGNIPVSQPVLQDTDFKYNIRVTDKSGNVANKEFTIRVKIDRPLLEAECPTASRKNMAYGCLLGPATQGNHTISYSGSSGFPAGLSIIGQSLVGTTTEITTGQTVTLKATNEYGVSTTKTFTLRVNNYCGDGIKQEPNMEERGGIYNDGYEDCDGTAGVVNSAGDSSRLKQYGCLTTATTSYPILTNDKCIFKSPLDGGGYCGDGYCQTQYENLSTCAKDCGVEVFQVSPITISGRATSYAYTNHPSVNLSSVSIIVTNDAVSTSTPIFSAVTDANGIYSITIPSASVSSSAIYTITASLAGYDNAVETFVPDSDQVINFMLSTPTYRGVNKIKLDWGLAPLDLDSHLTFGTSPAYHLAYCTLSAVPDEIYDVNNQLSASLDVDDVDSYGPENVRIVKYEPGAVYDYYVYNYSSCSGGTDDPKAAFGTTTVSLYNGRNGIIKTYLSSPTEKSCYWHVFSINSSGQVTDIDTYGNVNSGPKPNCD